MGLPERLLLFPVLFRVGFGWRESGQELLQRLLDVPAEQLAFPVDVARSFAEDFRLRADVVSDCLDRVFQVGIDFLEDEDLLAGRHKVSDRLGWQGVQRVQLHHLYPGKVRAFCCLEKLGVDHAGCDDAERAGAGHTVEWRFLELGFDGLELPVQPCVALVDRHEGGDEAIRLACRFEGRLLRGRVETLHLGYADAVAAGDPQDDDGLVALRELEGPSHRFPALACFRDLDHGQLAQGRNGTSVLLVLRSPGARVVAHQDDEAGVDARHIQDHHRVEGDVHTDALQADERPFARLGCASRLIQGDAFVYAPLRVVPVILRRLLEGEEGVRAR